jgi:DNA-binding protein HU-beta
MAKGMTKSEVLNAVAEKTGKSRKEVAEMMDALVSVAYDETKKSGEFTIPGLGKLLKKHREARMGRNPATGEQIKIAAKTVVKFRVAKAAKDAIL